jgi:hypothetical protein
VTDERLRDLLLEVPLPRADRERSFEVVRRAFLERERVGWPQRHVRHLAAAAVVLAAVGAVVSPPGRAVLDNVREAIGIERAQPALFSLPAPGRLLVTSPAGPWVVSQDGSKRLLGSYREASWSPFGRFVVAARSNELAAVDPGGKVRWTLARRGMRFPRWGGTPTDTRIAYLSGNQLRVVAGDGTGDRPLAAGVDSVAPAWRPGSRFVVVFARRGIVVALDVATGHRLWQRPMGPVRALSWSQAGQLLLVRSERSLTVLDAAGRTRFDLIRPGLSAPIEDAALAPNGRAVAFAQRTGGRSQLFIIARLRPDASAARRIVSVTGTFTAIQWSPNGRWLLVAWREADQWLFFRSAGVRAVHGVSAISSQFEGFPAIGGWCCAAS